MYKHSHTYQTNPVFERKIKHKIAAFIREKQKSFGKIGKHSKPLQDTRGLVY